MPLYFDDQDVASNSISYGFTGYESGSPDASGTFSFKVSLPDESILGSEDFLELANTFAEAVAAAIDTAHPEYVSIVSKRWHEYEGSTPQENL